MIIQIPIDVKHKIIDDSILTSQRGEGGGGTPIKPRLPPIIAKPATKQPRLHPDLCKKVDQ
jgi:hypothetical protein